MSCVLHPLFLLTPKQAKLRVVPWDGYLKYYNLGEKHPQLIEKRRKVREGAGESSSSIKSCAADCQHPACSFVCGVALVCVCLGVGASVQLQ
jgi:hypothetical protein